MRIWHSRAMKVSLQYRLLVFIVGHELPCSIHQCHYSHIQIDG